MYFPRFYFIKGTVNLRTGLKNLPFRMNGIIFVIHTIVEKEDVLSLYTANDQENEVSTGLRPYMLINVRRHCICNFAVNCWQLPFDHEIPVAYPRFFNKRGQLNGRSG